MDSDKVSGAAKYDIPFYELIIPSYEISAELKSEICIHYKYIFYLKYVVVFNPPNTYILRLQISQNNLISN